MLDKLLLKCQFNDPDRFRLAGLGLPLLASIDPQGEIHHLRHAWESIPSSFSDMAFRVFDYSPDRTNPDPFIEIKASPAKLSQGHNVIGSDDLADCALVLISVLSRAYPALVELLDYSSWEVGEVDITYASWASSDREAKQFIQALTKISNGQTRPSNSSFESTAYFGKKNSRLKKIKIYHKLAEILQYLAKRKGSKNDPSVYYTKSLMDWCIGMIRWEVTLKSRWFERRGIPTNLIEMTKVFNPQQYWTEATADLFKALEGETMKAIYDEDVLEKLKLYFSTTNAKTGKISIAKPLAAYRTYLAIKSQGYTQVKDLMRGAAGTVPTFYRHIDMLTACGFSKAQLQNMDGNQGAKIIPLIRYATVEFRSQFPDWYMPPSGGHYAKLSLAA